ncbi:hypothetical protein [Streptomyces sp. NBC_01431]|uniref:hypothetical protein n=1 Tax=Streptomyces sp. NBC_01431 TaxID=2903863 RepID=UPI002E381E69|nr:hypothetical protein [Streptomyces sp. NBC_01431]
MGLETRVQIVLELLTNAGVLMPLLGPSGLLVLVLGVLLAKGGARREPARPVPSAPRTNLVCVAAVLLVFLLIAAA